MTMFTYNTGVPFATNNPSNDQPQMLINTVSNNGIWNVDHVGFNSTGIIGNPQASGGQHLQVTFNGKHTPGFTPTDPLSVLFTLSGIASTNSNLAFQNQNGTFPLSFIRAFAVVDNSGNIVAGQSFNVTSIAQTGPGTSYTVTLPANVTNNLTNYAVFSQAADFNIILNSTPASPTSFVTRSITNVGINQYPTTNWWFIVLQL